MFPRSASAVSSAARAAAAPSSAAANCGTPSASGSGLGSGPFPLGSGQLPGRPLPEQAQFGLRETAARLGHRLGVADLPDPEEWGLLGHLRPHAECIGGPDDLAGDPGGDPGATGGPRRAVHGDHDPLGVQSYGPDPNLGERRLGILGLGLRTQRHQERDDGERRQQDRDEQETPHHRLGPSRRPAGVQAPGHPHIIKTECTAK